MTAPFQVGQILQGQEKFDEAIAAWKGYLAKFPNGPQSADAQRAILDTQLLIAHDHLRREQFAEARAAWLAFVAQNPLDGRVPQLLFEVGESFATEKKFDQAIAAWETLAGKFPGSEPAAHAQFRSPRSTRTRRATRPRRSSGSSKIAVEPWHGQAAQRIAVMEAKALAVVTARTFRSGETPNLKITTRNLEKLTFTAYKLDPEAYFRKKHALSGVESLDIGLVAPDAEWTAAVPGYAKYKPIETTYDLKKLEMPGVYVVKVTDEKTLQATTLVVGSDLDAIVKTSREQVLVFAQDMKTGKGRPGARVLVADGEGIILDAKTGADGVLLRDWDKPLEPGQGANAAEAVPVPVPIRRSRRTLRQRRRRRRVHARAAAPACGPAPRPDAGRRDRAGRPGAAADDPPPSCTPARRTGRSPTWCSTAATSPARAWACPTRSRRGSRPGPTSTPTARPTGPARRSSCAAWCARSRRPVCQRPRRGLLASRSPTAAAG